MSCNSHPQENSLREQTPVIPPIIVRPGQLKAVLGVPHSTVRRLEMAGQFPRRRRFSEGVVGWLYRDLEAWAQEAD